MVMNIALTLWKYIYTFFTSDKKKKYIKKDIKKKDIKNI